MSEGCAILEPLVSFTNVKGACFLHVKSLECEKLVTCAIVDPFSMCKYHQDCALVHTNHQHNFPLPFCPQRLFHHRTVGPWGAHNIVILEEVISSFPNAQTHRSILIFMLLDWPRIYCKTHEQPRSVGQHVFQIQSDRFYRCNAFSALFSNSIRNQGRTLSNPPTVQSESSCTLSIPKWKQFAD